MSIYCHGSICVSAFKFNPADTSSYVLLTASGHILTVPLTAYEVEHKRVSMLKDCFSEFFTLQLPTSGG
jgi:hypothetical protein